MKAAFAKLKKGGPGLKQALKKAQQFVAVPSAGRLPRLNQIAKQHPVAAAVVAAGVTTGLTLLIVRAMGSRIDAFVEGLPSSRGSDGDEQSYETLTESARAQDEDDEQHRPHRRRPWGA